MSAHPVPTGSLFEPAGELTFERAREVFREQVKAFADSGADIINFESFSDLAELKAAYFAAREICSLPVICSMTFENNGAPLWEPIRSSRLRTEIAWSRYGRG